MGLNRTKHKNFILYISIFVIIEVCLFSYLTLSQQSFFQITTDGKLYYNLAENFVAGKGLINTIRQEDIIVPPLFALILIPFVYFFHDGNSFIIFQFILFGINGILLYKLALQLFNGKTIAFFTVGLYAIHPVLLLNGPQYLLTETVFITFIIAITHISVLWVKNPSAVRYFSILLLLLSLSLLFRPHLLYVFPIVLGYWLYFVWKKKMKIISVVAFLCPVLLLGLNGLHNLFIHNEFVVLENYSGQNLYIANNPKTSSEFYASTRIHHFVGEEYFQYDSYSLSEKSAILKEKAINYMLQEPFETLKRLIARSFLFFKGISLLDWATIFLSIFGWLLAFIKDKQNRSIYLYLLFIILGFAGLTSAGLLVGGQRYRTPIIPVYLLFGGYCLYQIFPLKKSNI